MMFADNAARLCGQLAVLLGWRPGEFWAATPAELQCILAAMTPPEQPALDSLDMKKMMEQFPDG